MQQQFLFFLIRWVLNSLGLWLAARLLSGSVSYDTTDVLPTFLLAGLILSIVNAVLKPLVVILSLPAILLTLGLFTLVVNGFMVYLAVKISPDIDMTFFASIITGIIISLINYVITNASVLKDGGKAKA